MTYKSDLDYWQNLPSIAQSSTAQKWLILQSKLQLAPNTISAYQRGLEEYLSFLAKIGIEAEFCEREHVVEYVRYISERPNQRMRTLGVDPNDCKLSNATLQQYLTVARLFNDFLVEEGLRSANPVGRGYFTPGHSFGGQRHSGLLRRYSKLPWIPSDEQWQSVLLVAREESLRNKLMLALAYDSGLRREELCLLETGDVDPSQRLIRVRAETTKNRMGRIVPYSKSTDVLYKAYLVQRRELSRDRGPLFLSESRRNRSQPLSFWTWSKVVRQLAMKSGVPEFTTHTTRHLCLTDLARSGWDIHEISRFAGHRNPQTTLIYIHLSGRDLINKFERGMSSIHQKRMELNFNVLK